AMRWLVASLVLAGCLVHGYALTWVFALPVEASAWLAATAIAALLSAGLLRGSGARAWPLFAASLLLTPMLHAQFWIDGPGAAGGWARLSPEHVPTLELLI